MIVLISWLFYDILKFLSFWNNLNLLFNFISCGELKIIIFAGIIENIITSYEIDSRAWASLRIYLIHNLLKMYKSSFSFGKKK